MNATRRLAKKSADVVQVTYEKGKASFTKNMVQGVLIVLLIAYSGVLIRYMPIGFLTFFEHIAVKIVALVVIAFVGLYSPAVALFLAIALICTLQMAQKKKLMDDIRLMAPAVRENMYNFTEKLTGGGPNGVLELMENSSDEPQAYLDPEVMMKMEEVPSQKPQMEVRFNTPSDEYVPFNEGSSNDDEDDDVPDGFNENASCLPCDGDSSDSALNSQCGHVQTWKHQFSAQGLGMDITGYQGSVGYPV